MQRNENKYFQLDKHKRELKRLNNQRRILREFDRDIYEKVQKEYDELVILDVGSNRGDLIIDRMGNAGNLGKLLGLEYDEASVKDANCTYGISDKISFFQMDVEADDFSDNLEECMAQMDIEKFNVIHISMLILHLKNPYKVLKKLRRYLSEDGIMLIKDIDDGLNFAYPDDDNEFKRVVSICSRNETSGFRESGRQIYTLLKRAGYASVRLEKSGLCTAEMGYDDREALFDTYFSFVLADLKTTAERHPDDDSYKDDLEWFEGVYDELEQKFQDDNFLFSLGFMIYTARKGAG